MTRRSLSADQLLRIEALKTANDFCGGQSYVPSPADVVARAEAYLSFLKAKTPSAAPKPSSPKRKK
jgi:hypothetical protein